MVQVHPRDTGAEKGAVTVGGISPSSMDIDKVIARAKKRSRNNNK